MDDSFDHAISVLREDANERGMLDLALVYGWSQIKCRNEIIEEQIAAYRKAKQDLPKQ